MDCTTNIWFLMIMVRRGKLRAYQQVINQFKYHLMKKYVWFADDASNYTAYNNWIEEEKSSLWRNPNNHHTFAVAGGDVGDRYYQTLSLVAIDALTGCYYTVSNDTSVSGNTFGIFYNRGWRTITLFVAKFYIPIKKSICPYSERLGIYRWH